MTAAPDLLVHLCGTQDWAAAQHCGGIHPSSMIGFIHLSSPQQVHLPANRLFSGRSDLVLLHIDPAALESPVLWEPGVPADPESMLFPHLYGPLLLDAVIKATPYPPGADGTFPPAESS